MQECLPSEPSDKNEKEYQHWDFRHIRVPFHTQTAGKTLCSLE